MRPRRTATGVTPDLVFTKADQIQNAVRTPGFVDANWVGLWPRETDGPWRDLYTGAPFAISPPYKMKRPLPMTCDAFMKLLWHFVSF
jgi:hypothetical protein